MELPLGVGIGIIGIAFGSWHRHYWSRSWLQVQVQVQEKVNELDPEPQHTQFGTKSSPNGSRKKLSDHSDQFLGFQNAANLSR